MSARLVKDHEKAYLLMRYYLLIDINKALADLSRIRKRLHEIEFLKKQIIEAKRRGLKHFDANRLLKKPKPDKEKDYSIKRRKRGQYPL